MNRRTFLTSLGALGAAAPFVPAALPAAPTVSAPEELGGQALFACLPYAQWTAPGVTVIRWRTARPSTAFLFWSQEPAAPRDRWVKACTVQDGMIAANTCDHAVTLRGLDPAKPLAFEAVSEPIASFGAYSIKRGATVGSGVRTLRPMRSPEGALSLAIFNDIHGRLELIPKLLALESTVQAAPAAALFNGDCMDDCGSVESAQKRFLRALPPLAEAGLSTLFLRGNHEYRGAMARRIREVLSPLDCGRYYGAFTLGSVRFLCIDTGEDKPDSAPVYGGLLQTDAYIDEQAAWLAREIESPEWKTAPWRVAVMHIPPTCGNVGDNDDWYGPTRLRKIMDPLFAKANLQAMICAHTHVYNFLPPEKTGRPYPILIGGGPSEKSATVTLLKASNNVLDIRAFRANGAALDGIIHCERRA